MTVRTMLVVLLALTFGGSAVVGVNTLLNANRATAAAPATEPVVVAAVAIPRGGTVSADQVKTVEFPKGLLPPGAITKVEDAVDRGVFTPLVPGEPVLESKLAPKGAGRGLAALVAKGMRAYTIPTPGVAAQVAGFILPGNKVDVLFTDTADGKGGNRTMTLLQNVEILAVDQQIDAPAENKVDVAQLRSVTLQVTPREASLLDLAQNKGGQLHLSLRNPDDNLPAASGIVTLDGLFPQRAPSWDERAKGVIDALGKALAERPVAPPERPVVPRKARIRTIRGPAEGQVTVPLPVGTSTRSR